MHWPGARVTDVTVAGCYGGCLAYSQSLLYRTSTPFSFGFISSSYFLIPDMIIICCCYLFISNDRLFVYFFVKKFQSNVLLVAL